MERVMDLLSSIVYDIDDGKVNSPFFVDDLKRLFYQGSTEWGTKLLSNVSRPILAVVLVRESIAHGVPKVRGSNPTFASRLPLSKLGRPGSIPALLLPSGGMAVRHRKVATTEQLQFSISMAKHVLHSNLSGHTGYQHANECHLQVGVLKITPECPKLTETPKLHQNRGSEAAKHPGLKSQPATGRTNSQSVDDDDESSVHNKPSGRTSQWLAFLRPKTRRAITSAYATFLSECRGSISTPEVAETGREISSSISITKLKRKGEREQPCLTPLDEVYSDEIFLYLRTHSWEFADNALIGKINLGEHFWSPNTAKGRQTAQQASITFEECGMLNIEVGCFDALEK
ncbi:hypothetical protein T265_08671 [Opisthorchis viverrini]|uniref:Uncharacterized protein n=1 Tax=Opisthorchis viverrini TaxID=6198 RepID=A0A074ZCU2_OPIVI|nr:hypothetical protein T265_08671 [Opisthorchis viverrini]KER23452.1 hypothetical protein T265_08671 [Opisthorchis viverrini]